jgi:hypothetical protein
MEELLKDLQEVCEKHGIGENEYGQRRNKEFGGRYKGIGW